MFDLLQLDGWTMADLWDEGGELVIAATFDREPDGCPKCGVIGSLYRHGKKPVRYRDSPIRGQAVTLQASAQRYFCRDCGETSIQPLEGIDATRQMTIRCREHIEEQCLRKTFTELAADIGCNEKTIRNIAKAHVRHLEQAFTLYAPQWLGIDELHVAGGVRGIFTDVGNKQPIDMIAKRTKPDVGRWLDKLPGKERVEGVTMDMWRPYRDLVREKLPQADVVVDKYHVLAMVSRGLDSVRKSLWQTQTKKQRRYYKRRRHMLYTRPHKLSDKQYLNLTGWLNNEPELRKAYQLKEAFWEIYELDERGADAALSDWPMLVPDHLQGHFQEIISALENWHDEILAYFRHGKTNAYTETVNGLAKTIYRQGRGYSWEVLRARVLYKYRKPLAMKGSGEASYEHYKLARDVSRLRRFLLDNFFEQECQSCHGRFHYRELETVHTGPVVVALGEGEKVTPPTVMCEKCHRRLRHEQALG